MTATRRPARSARAAEPSGIGSASARDPLALEVRLLGSLLGQVITEQAGESIYDLVERLRLAAIAFRGEELGLRDLDGPVVGVVSGGNVDPAQYRAYLEAPLPG